ncbi:MAG TPA: imidazolonepropionase [Acidimicrobiales bacterium]|nr:imidazolonepropionase [Acidimicrobiales bacterium]
MTSLAVTGIGVLMTGDPEQGEGALGLVKDAALVADGGVVVYAGPGAGAPLATDERLDVAGRAVLPGFVDSHTHLVFAGDRAGEFVARMAGRPYRPGGIIDTVRATRAAPADDLRRRTGRLVAEARAAGTTTIEIKTGYGLDPDHEQAHLELAAGFTDEVTFLGAHLVPPEFASDRAGYLDLLVGTMVPVAAGRARWCDVFCEEGAFDVDESAAVLDAAGQAGLGLRVHANQLGPGGGVQLACRMGAASADHCTHLAPADIDALSGSATVATLLPISDFCTRQPYPDGRALLDAGVAVALASNCNPGSSFSTSMPLALALAVRECGLTVDEALLAATAGGAAALRRSDVGRLVPGRRADAVILDAPHPHHLVYRLGAPLVWAVVQAGLPGGGAESHRAGRPVS